MRSSDGYLAEIEIDDGEPHRANNPSKTHLSEYCSHEQKKLGGMKRYTYI
jgi:hypothetical protein